MGLHSTTLPLAGYVSLHALSAPINGCAGLHTLTVPVAGWLVGGLHSGTAPMGEGWVGVFTELHSWVDVWVRGFTFTDCGSVGGFTFTKLRSCVGGCVVIKTGQDCCETF